MDLWDILYPTGRYNLNFDICTVILCLFLFIILFSSVNYGYTRSKIFLTIDAHLGISSLFEFFALVARNNPASTSISNATVFNVISHVTINMIPFFVLLYLIHYTGLSKRLTRKWKILISVPATAMILLTFIPYTRQLLFYITADGVYHHGPLFPFYYIQSLVYLLTGVGLIFVSRRAIGKRATAALFVIIAVIFAMFVIQSMNPYLKMTNFVLAVCILGTYLVIDNQYEVTDTETGAYNRYAFLKDSRMLFTQLYSSEVISVKLQDIGYFTVSFGVDNIEKLLEVMTRYLKGICPGERVYYTGNGIFNIICFGDRNAVEEKAETIRKRFCDGWSNGTIRILFPSQVWTIRVPDSVTSPASLMMVCDAGFDIAYGSDKVHASDEMTREQRRRDVEQAIARALEKNSFEVYYQPIFDTRTQTFRSAEALIRMKDEKLGFVSPEEFIKIAEQDGTITRIGDIVFESVCRFLHERHPEKYGLEYIEVNLSTIQCMDPDLVSRFRSIMNRYNVRPDQINLEITESGVIHNWESMKKTVQDFYDSGIRFSLDDFGTGFSNYTYILSFPFSIIKVDKSILWAADHSAENRLLLLDTIKMYQDLQRDVVVEGVETEQHRELLEEADTHYLQGYLFSKPVPQDAFVEYIANAAAV